MSPIFLKKIHKTSLFSLLHPTNNRPIPEKCYFYDEQSKCFYYYIEKYKNNNNLYLFLIQSFKDPMNMKYKIIHKNQIVIHNDVMSILKSQKMFHKLKLAIKGSKYDIDNKYLELKTAIDLLMHFSIISRKNVGIGVDVDVIKDNDKDKTNGWVYKARPKPRYSRRSRNISERFRHTNIDETNILFGSRKRRFKPLV